MIKDDEASPCPHCRTHVHMQRIIDHSIELDSRCKEKVDSGATAWRISGFRCPVCGRPVLCVQELRARGSHTPINRIVFPVAHQCEPVQYEVPEPYRSDYEEACAVLPISPKAAAAIARRLLQMLLHGPGCIPPKRNLKDEIDIAMPELPRPLAEHLHILREYGNFAAHPMPELESGVILDVEPGEAQFTIEVVHEVFDHYFVRPARFRIRKEALNQKLTMAGKRPLM